MTININKELGSVSTIKFKGLGDPGPFSFTVLSGNLPTGTSLETLTGKLIGTFTTIGIFDFKIKVFKHDRIQAIEDVNIAVENWNLVRTDFRSLVDESGTAWVPVSGSLTKVTDDPLLFDGQCYETTASGLTMPLAKSIGERDFELEFIFKPVNNGGTDASSRYLMIGPNNTKGTFVFYRKVNTGQPRLSISHCPNDSNFVDITSTDPVLDPDVWNHVLFIKKRETISLYVNFVKIFSSSLKHNFSGTTLYLASSEANTQKFNCRVKKLSLRINDSKDYLNNKIVNDVFRFKIINKKIIFLSSLYHNSLAIETNYLGNFTVRVKENSSLPTGLSLINNKITGLSQLLDNKFVYLELVIQGVVHDTIELEILSLDRPNYILELPLTGELNNDVFGDTKSRQWIKNGAVTLLNDDDVVETNTSVYFNGVDTSLYLEDPTFALGLDDFEYSFWVKPEDEGGSANKRYIQHGLNNQEGTFVIFGGGNTSPTIQLAYFTNGSWTYNITPTVVTLDKNKYSFVKFKRVKNIWSFFVNHVLISEVSAVFNVLGKKITIGDSDTKGQYLKARMLDLKLSKFILDQRSPSQINKLIKWKYFFSYYFAPIGGTLKRNITSSMQSGDFKCVVDPTSALPLGLSLSENGSVTGVPTVTFDGSVKVNCFVDGVFNDSININFLILSPEDFLVGSLYNFYKMELKGTGIGYTLSRFALVEKYGQEIVTNSSNATIIASETAGGWPASNLLLNTMPPDASSAWYTTTTKDPVFLTIELHENKKIEELRIVSNYSTYHYTVNDFKFYGSRNGIDWHLIKEVVGANAPNDGSWVSFDLR